MKKLMLFFVLLGLVVPVAAPATDGPAVYLKPSRPGPGDIMIVTVKGVKGPVEGAFADRKLHFVPFEGSYKAVLGVDLYTEPGAYKLEISADGKDLSRTITVKKKKYPLQKLTLPEGMVELSAEDEARVEREQKKISAIWPNETDRHWSGNFINPRAGEISTVFGVRRMINGRPKNSHSGVDVSADEGAEVSAPNNGIVALVDDHFFSGRSIILDHGHGIYTMFFHLSKILVTEGQQVKKGEVIGLVGSTGRSTGAHLHWGVRVQGARVDPLALIKLKLD